MVSRAILATHPRHRPSRDAIDAGWRETGPGQWMRDEITVCLEIDGLWHSYVQVTDTRRHSPGFLSVHEAMRDAEVRARLDRSRSSAGSEAFPQGRAVA